MNEYLSLPSSRPRDLKLISSPRRLALVAEAIDFESLELNNKFYTSLYRFEDFEIKVGKPGKEFGLDTIKYKSGLKGNNPNDMSPTIFRNNVIVARNGSFEDVFKQFIHIFQSPQALRLIGCLCVRNAFTIDHIQNEEGNWRYTPPREVIQEINRTLPADFPEPIEVFLHYLELIALNEDVKYHTLGFDIKSGIGRENNLLTYAHIIHIILHKNAVSEGEFLLELMRFAGGLVRPPVGLNPLSLKRALEVFPMLQPIN